MDLQSKGGLLELLILKSVSKEDRYGYELTEDIGRAFDAKEGTVYPLLKKMTNEKFFETYLRESPEGPPRKYYKLAPLGQLELEKLMDQWQDLRGRIDSFLEE